MGQSDEERSQELRIREAEHCSPHRIVVEILRVVVGTSSVAAILRKYLGYCVNIMIAAA